MAAIGIALLLFLIVQRKVHAFVALLLVSVVIGLGAQWPAFDPTRLLRSMQDGMAGTLGFVAVVVGLGAMFGRLLEVSGGAQVLAQGLLQRWGTERAPWALCAAGFLISVPVFFDVAFVVLVPLVYELSKKSGRPLMAFALPLLAGLLVTHSFVPPTPGPIGVAAILGADLGLVILFGTLAGVPAAILAGPVLGRLLATRVPGKAMQDLVFTLDTPTNMPSFRLVAGLIALPIGLILTGALVNAFVPPEVFASFGEHHPMRYLHDALTLLGHPFIALLVTTLVCFRVLGTGRGLSREQVSDIATKSLEPVGIIILVTGAGGVLKQVMIDTQVGKVLADQLVGLGFVPVLLGFVIALVVRVMQGSATVAMLTAAGLVIPVIEPTEPSAALRALLVVPIAAGASCLSHVNDSGFWLVSRYLGLSVPETLKTWTLMSTVVGVCGLVVSLALSFFIH